MCIRDRSSADMVMKDGDMVGMNMFNGYSFNERCFLSLAVVNEDVQIGDVLNLVWGEPDDSDKTSTTVRSISSSPASHHGRSGD